jgi:hypothetical protein
MHLRFPRHGAHLLLVTRGQHDAAPPLTQEVEPATVEVEVDGEWQCRAEGENVLRLDRFSFTTIEATARTAADDEAGAAMKALAAPDVPIVEPKPLVNVLQDLERAGAPWPVGVEAAPVFGAPPALLLKLPVTAWYAARFDAEHVPPSVKLCLEDAALQGEWGIWVNGQQVPPEAFGFRRRWDVGNREAEVAPLLRSGRNEVLVRVRAGESWEGLIDAVYLLGDFGVTFDSSATPRLVRPPARVRWDELFGEYRAAGGYPYYAGTLHLSRTVRFPATEGDIVVRLPDEHLMFAGVAQLAINGQALGVRAWAPYAWRIAAGVISSGENEITLSVTNTLVGLLEGKRYDPQRREAVPLVERVS